MNKWSVIAPVLLAAIFAVLDAGFLATSFYAEEVSVKNNFVPRKGAMAFIEFTRAPENHGIRDMRSLRKRYARYRGGRFEVTSPKAQKIDNSGAA